MKGCAGRMFSDGVKPIWKWWANHTHLLTVPWGIGYTIFTMRSVSNVLTD